MTFNEVSTYDPNRPLLVVAAALLDTAERVLVQQRAPGKAHARLWEFPGGKVEPGEAPEEALARELLEELGIGIDPTDAEPFTFAGDAAAVILLYRVRRWVGEPVALDAAALLWEHPAGLTQLPMPPLDVPLAAALAG